MPKVFPTTTLIIGHVTHNSVRVWCRNPTGRSGSATITLNKGLGGTMEERIITFERERHGITIADFSEKLTPESEYQLILQIVDGETFTGNFKTKPSPDVFKPCSFMFASCFLNRNYLVRRKHRVYPNLHRISKETDAAFMIFCGDQIYIDTINASTPKNPTYEMYEQKYLDNWSLEGAAKFFRNTPSYMILDDHEIGNDFDNSRKELVKNKEIGLQVYRDYQHSHNPNTEDGEYFYQFQFGTIQFFVIDTRTERDRSHNYIISDKQEKAFTLWLNEHKTAMKVVISPVTFIIQPKGRREKWSDPAFGPQYNRVMSKVLTNKDPKLVFLTGDYHCGIHGKIKHEGSEEGQGEWHEFMAGPLNQVLVNPANVFEKERTLLVDKEQNIKVEYKRMQVESKFTNVGSVRIEKEEGFYTVQVTWYRAQHESGVEEIGRTAVVRLKS